MANDFTFSADRAAELLSVMANDGRLRVFKMIMLQEWDVGSLAVAVNLSQSALSQHLKKMREAKLVQARRDAQNIYYSCSDTSVQRVMATLEEIYGSSTSEKAAA